MAAVTGELTGQPGTVLVAPGPGVTASASGVAHARFDRAPVLLLSGCHPEAAARQPIDHAAFFAPIVKGSVAIAPESANHWLAHAVHLALRDPRGPVHLDLPADVARRPGLPAATSVTPAPLPIPDAADLDRAGALIGGARRPVVVAGLHCRGEDGKWLRAFCEALPAPVLTTGKAKGAMPEPHPLALGLLTGGALEEPLLRRADLVIALGLDPVELPPRPWPFAAPVLSLARVHGDDPALGVPLPGPIRAVLEVVGELAGILDELAPRLARKTATDWDVAEVDRLRRQRRSALDVPATGLSPLRVARVARELTAAGTVAAVDPGAHALAITEGWEATEAGEVLMSTGLAAAGYALPAALAAQLALPDRRALCFIGRRGLLRVAVELETAVRLGLPVVIVGFEDGMAPAADGQRDARALSPESDGATGPDLVAVGRCFGVESWAADSEAGLVAALSAALRSSRPTLVSARVDPAVYARMREIADGGPAAGKAS